MTISVVTSTAVEISAVRFVEPLLDESFGAARFAITDSMDDDTRKSLADFLSKSVAAYQAGVDHYLPKPLTSDSLTRKSPVRPPRISSLIS